MAGAASRMASAQPGLCRRNRRIDQNDAALRPMPARRAPPLAGSVGSAGKPPPSSARCGRNGPLSRLAPSTGRSTARSSALGSSSSWFLNSSPAISWCWTICRATRSQGSERPPWAKARLLYLPAYSPDLNPIEQWFAKLKALLRKAAARSFDALIHAIGRALEAFTPDECANYLANSGYPHQ